jgi:2Fe-2S ferredoxin
MKVTFLPSGRTCEVAAGVTLAEAIRAAGLPLGSACRGEGACGWCRVRVVGDSDGALSAVEPRERELLARLEAAQGERIACQARVLGALAVTASYW